MTQAARVMSVDALKDFRTSLVQFGQSARQALGAAEMDLRRVFDWLNDQHAFWQQAVRQAEEELLRAKMELQSRKAQGEEGRGPGYTEREAAVKKAQERVRYATEKVDVCRRWQLRLPREILEYEGPARRLAGMLEADLRLAVALLDRKTEALEAYLAVAAPDAPAARTTEKKEG